MTGTALSRMQSVINLLQSPDDAVRSRARKDLVGLAYARYRFLATRMLDVFPRLRSWIESSDVFQNALLRLDRALAAASAAHVPGDESHVRSLIRLQIRRELLELLRDRQFQAWSRLESDSGSPCLATASDSFDPARLAEWTEFHTETERLRDREREVFERIYYEGMTYQEVADDLDMSTGLVKLRYAEAKKNLADRLRGGPGNSQVRTKNGSGGTG